MAAWTASCVGTSKSWPVRFAGRRFAETGREPSSGRACMLGSRGELLSM